MAKSLESRLDKVEATVWHLDFSDKMIWERFGELDKQLEVLRNELKAMVGKSEKNIDRSL